MTEYAGFITFALKTVAFAVAGAVAGQLWLSNLPMFRSHADN